MKTKSIAERGFGTTGVLVLVLAVTLLCTIAGNVYFYINLNKANQSNADLNTQMAKLTISLNEREKDVTELTKNNYEMKLEIEKNKKSLSEYIEMNKSLKSEKDNLKKKSEKQKKEFEEKNKQTMQMVNQMKARLQTLEYQNAKKGKAPVVTGQHSLHGKAYDLKAGSFMTYKELFDKLANYKMVFAGEVHDNLEHHLTQAKIIEEMYKRDKNFVIGMEMFDVTQQDMLDNYINGKIDETQFRKDFDVAWGFPFDYYKPIFDVAKKYKIKIVALNAPKSIVSKIGKQGFGALTAEERALLAKDIDTSNQTHRNFIQAQFGQHGSSFTPEQFENFYSAQCTWEDTMAQSVADYLKQNAGSKMVIVIGEGHVNYGFGVPNRAKNRLKSDYYSVYNLPANYGSYIDLKQLSSSQLASSVIFSRRTDDLKTLNFGLNMSSSSFADAVSNQNVQFTNSGLMNNFNLNQGDVIKKINGNSINSFVDLYWNLLMLKSGDSVTLEIENNNSTKTITTVMYF